MTYPTTNLQSSIKLLQFFGSLIVCDLKGKIIGISKNTRSLLNKEPSMYLTKNIEDLINDNFYTIKTELYRVISSINETNKNSEATLYKIKDDTYYINCYLHNTKIYLEFEKQISNSLSYSDLKVIGPLLANNLTDIWGSLCNNLLKITNYDRVMIYKTEPAGAGKIIAEASSLLQQCFIGDQYSEEFLSPEIAPFYNNSVFRYCPNISKCDSEFLSVDNDINLKQSQFALYPELHSQYLKSICIRSIINIPIIINGSFWGIVIANNYEEKKLDFSTRQFCALLTQFASSKYETKLKQKIFNYNNEIRHIKDNLKRQLISSKSINGVLMDNREILCKVVKADGIAILFGGDIFTYGDCPGEIHISRINDIVNDIPDEPIFKDFQFNKIYKNLYNEDLSSAGILTLQIANRTNNRIIWFRKEIVEKILQVKPKTISREYRGPYRLWTESSISSSIPWSKNNIYFAECLNKLIHEIIVIKSQEQENHNEELVALNNELEMLTFTLSHDLKNPLSILKIGTQFLERNIHMKDHDRMKWNKTILSSVENIESIINGLLELGKTKAYALRKNPIPMTNMINRIIQDSIILYDSKNCQVNLGELIPILGEKSLLFQVFSNVIGNAVKYSSLKPNPIIEISSVIKGNKVEYIVKDNGIGIPLEFLKSIYNVFKRADNTENFSGTGVGLCLVKRIMEKLGGDITIKSSLNEQTVIKLTFPSTKNSYSSLNINKKSSDKILN